MVIVAAFGSSLTGVVWVETGAAHNWWPVVLGRAACLDSYALSNTNNCHAGHVRPTFAADTFSSCANGLVQLNGRQRTKSIANTALVEASCIMYNADGSLRASTKQRYPGGNNRHSVHDSNFNNGQVCAAS